MTPFKGGGGSLKECPAVNILSAAAGARADRDDERVTTTTQEFNLQGKSCIFSSMKSPRSKGEEMNEQSSFITYESRDEDVCSLAKCQQNVSKF